MALFEIKIEIRAGLVDAAEEILLEHGSEQWSVLEDAIAKRAWLVGLCASVGEAQQQWNELAPLLGGVGVVAIGAPVEREMANADWRESYKAHFKAWQFGRLHWVPLWEKTAFQCPPGDAVLWLDPGLAFGTGNHETTRLCVERLVALAARFEVRGLEFGVQDDGNPALKSPISKRDALRVVDAGCGSGILALSAVVLGFGDIVGFDNDPEAVRVSEENAVMNGLEGRVTFFVGDLVSGLAGREAQVVLANIQADVLMRFAPELVKAVAPGGTLALSGILARENAQVRAVFEAIAPQWTIEARVMGEWSDIALTCPP